MSPTPLLLVGENLGGDEAELHSHECHVGSSNVWLELGREQDVVYRRGKQKEQDTLYERNEGPVEDVEYNGRHLLADDFPVSHVSLPLCSRKTVLGHHTPSIVFGTNAVSPFPPVVIGQTYAP